MRRGTGGSGRGTPEGPMIPEGTQLRDLPRGRVQVPADLIEPDAVSQRLRASFASAARQWRRETAASSDISEIISNRWYLRIIALGKEVVPLILQELSTSPGWWFAALEALTGDNPASACGTPGECALAWLGYGREKGHI